MKEFIITWALYTATLWIGFFLGYSFASAETVLVSASVPCNPMNYHHSDCQIEDLYYLEVTTCSL